MKEKIVIIGAGPLGINAAHIIQQQNIFKIVGFIDFMKGTVAGLPLIGDDSVLDSLKLDGVDNAVVCIGDSHKRIAISEEIKRKGFEIPTLIHPSADLGIGSTIGEGSIIFHSAFIGPETIIGPYCIVEAGAFIGHNAILHEGVLLSARTVVGNQTSIGRCTTFKIGAGCANKLSIGCNCRVGEFYNILTNIADNEVV